VDALRVESAAGSLQGFQVTIPLRACRAVSCECCALCRYRPMRRADPLYREVLLSEWLSLRVINCDSHRLGTNGSTKLSSTNMNITCEK